MKNTIPKIDHSNIDYKNMEMAGSSKPKVKKSEILKGFRMIYLFLCLCFFLLIIADTIDGTKIYIKYIGFWIIFFIPCVIHLIRKVIKPSQNENTITGNIIEQYNLLRQELMQQEKEWQDITFDISCVEIKWSDLLGAEQSKKDIKKINKKIDVIESAREKRSINFQ